MDEFALYPNPYRHAFADTVSRKNMSARQMQQHLTSTTPNRRPERKTMIRRSEAHRIRWGGARARALALVVAAATAFAMLFAASPAQASESWTHGAASCNYQYSVKVHSYATGSTVRHEVTASGTTYTRTWNNSGAYIWRSNSVAQSVSWVHVYSSLAISNAYLSCVYNP